jgi:hypothetical protein
MRELETLTDAAIWPHATLYADVNYPYRVPLTIQIRDQLIRIEPFGRASLDTDDFVRSAVPRRVLETLHEFSMWMHADRKHGDRFDPYFTYFLTDKRERDREDRDERLARKQHGVEITWSEAPPILNAQFR